MLSSVAQLASYSSLKEINKLLPKDEKAFEDLSRFADYIKVTKMLVPYDQDPDLKLKHKQAYKQYKVCLNILALGQFLYFGGGQDEPLLYFLPHSPLLSSAPIYERLPTTALRRLVRSCSESILTPTEVKAIIETFLDIPSPNEEIERRVFAISDKLYWDRETASLLPAPPSTTRCFFRLFDSKESEKNVVAFAPSTFDATFSDRVQTSFESFSALLEDDPSPFATDSSDSPYLPISFPFILDWADGSVDLYWDLMKIIATTFMRKRPDVAFFLTGTGFNGKSQFVGLLHTIVGARNTSRVPLSEIGDHHITNSLRFSLLNAPDDEGGNQKKDDINNFTKQFKQIASHETLTLPVLYRQTPVEMKADFMSVFPMNMFPRWSGSDVSALTRRTVIVPFNHDFRDHPVHYANFAQEVYTPSLLASLLGQVLAIARYYRDTPLTFSNTLNKYAEQTELENDTPRVYARLFEKFFKGFQNKKLLYEDYRNWVKHNDAGIIVTMGAFRNYWNKYFAGERTKAFYTTLSGERRRTNVYQVPSSAPKYVLIEDQSLHSLGVRTPDYFGGTVGEALERGFSVVDILQKQLED